VKDGVGMEMLDLQLVVKEQPPNERMQGWPEAALVEGCEHNHLIIPWPRHLALIFQPPS
jgi:hypothetical protein